ncbi:MAG: hypothetical protein ACI94Y_000761 [Maribacter sp.]|jgi:hypothetical protein
MYMLIDSDIVSSCELNELETRNHKEFSRLINDL